MQRSLVPCSGCHRHIDAHAAVCPFCARPFAPTAPRGSYLGQLSRVAIFAGAAACSHSRQPTPAGPTTTTTTSTPSNDRRMDKGTLSGRVQRTSGSPIPFARLELRSLETNARAVDISADRDGRYQVRDVAPGRYQLRLRGQRHTNGEQVVDVTIAPGDNTADITEPDRPEYDPSQIPAPYGAPPARRRIV